MQPVVLFNPERFLEHSNQRIRKDLKQSWGVLIQAFIKDQEVSDSSKDVYTRNIRKFVLWLAHEKKLDKPDQLCREDLLEYKTFLKLSQLSASSINSYLILMRKLFEWLESKKLFPNIGKGIKGLKTPNNRMRSCFSIDQLKEILSCIDTDTIQGVRNYAMLNLMCRTGLRCVEISRSTISDLRQESGEAVLWVQGKGRDSKDDFVLLVHEALKPLRHYLSLRKPQSLDEPLFAPLQPKFTKNKRQKVTYTTVTNRHLTTRMISMIAKKAFRNVGIDSRMLTAHSLRHTAITLAITHGASIEQTAAMARHSDIATTMRYYHNMQRVSEFAAERYIKLNKYEDHVSLNAKKQNGKSS